MADARIRQAEKTRMVEQRYTAEDGVVLELTHEETTLIAFILGHKIVGGSGRWERRVSDGIWDKLGPFGYHFRGKHYKDVEAWEKCFDLGFINFKRSKED